MRCLKWRFMTSCSVDTPRPLKTKSPLRNGRTTLSSMSSNSAASGRRQKAFACMYRIPQAFLSPPPLRQSDSKPHSLIFVCWKLRLHSATIACSVPSPKNATSASM